MLQLSVEHVSIAYERETIVKDISFTVEEGDYVCVLGENGSGKSTLLKGILGLVPLQEGAVSFHGETERSHVGYLPQMTQAQKDFPASVMEVVLSGCLNGKGLRPFYVKKERDAAMDNLKRLGIAQLAGKSYRRLSGGQQQRVLLARALCATDKIMFLDEPVSGLDPAAAAEFYQLIGRLNKEKHMSVVMVSHDIDMALREADKVLHICREGCFFGTKKEYIGSGLGREFMEVRNGGEGR